MRRVLILSPSQQPSYFLLLPSPPPPISSGFNLNNKVSPSILLIIIILAIIFFISGLLHLLVRFLLRPSNRDPDEMDNVTALQGQLQQLFHLHDAGVDQSFIDTLPVFNYKAIMGVKLDPFDCAVCLCEFEAEDKLRLLPKCSHAFHMECIDTWLLSHSTCPLCRATLLGDYSTNYTNNPSPIVLVLESGSESSREIFNNVSRTNSVARVNSSPHFGDEDKKSGEIQEKEEEKVILGSGEKVVSVKLGKFQSVGERSNDSDSNAEARRCFSMGSFTYVMDENSSLQVPIRTPLKKKQSNKKKPLIPGHRLAMSECGCDSSRELFNGLDDVFKINQDIQNNSSCSSSSSKKESFSVSKIWLRGKKDDQGTVEEPSRRAFSFRFPVESKGKNGRRTTSEINMRRWENEVGFDEETQSCNSLDSMQANPPSFARRTLLWLMGKPNKVVHSSFSGIV